MTQRSTVVGSNTEPGQNIGVQGVAGALSSDARSTTNAPQTQIALAVQHIKDGPSITNGPQTFAQGSQYPRTETSPSTVSQLSIAHAQGIVRDPEFGGTQGVAAALSSDGLSSTHSVDITKVLFSIGIVESVALAAFGLLKLKAHKDNPQQTPLPIPLCTIIISCP